MNKNIVIGVLVVLTLLVGGLYFSRDNGSSLSGMPFLEHQAFQQGLTVGERATPLKKVYTGTCTIVSNSSISATSTGTGTCAITGLLAGDQVFVGLATTSVAQSRNILLLPGAVAAANSATVRLFNLTGGNIVPASVNGFGSSSPYMVFRD